MCSNILFIGTSELLLIAALVLLLFGGKKLPEMMRGLGQGVKSFKEGMKESTDETKQEVCTGEHKEKRVESSNEQSENNGK